MILKEERIGGQRLLLGDCLEIMAEIDSFDHVVSDPPYEESMHKNKNSTEKMQRYDRGPELRGLDFQSIDAIRKLVVEQTSNICTGWSIFFCTAEGVAKWEANILENTIMRYKRACVWVKPDSAPNFTGQGPAAGFECFVCAWSGQGRATWNAGGKRGVYKHIVNPPDRHGGHPTEKPWRLFAEILLDFVKPAQTVLDPFMGSGTTLVAAQKTGRNATGIEMNPDYFAMACERVDQASRQNDLFIEHSKPHQNQQHFEYTDPDLAQKESE